MKQKIKIMRNDETIFKGKAANIKIKEDFVINKSIELFDDDEPCIIHQSYVIKEYANILLELFKENNTKEIKVKNHLEELAFLNYESIEELIITLG